MARDRKLSSDFWTWEAVIDCAPMTRLLFLGLQNFADDHGVQPLKPRTIRLRVFPGDDIDDGRVRAMIDELVAHGLLRIYEVEGDEYLAVVDWERIHRVGARARARYPRDPSLPAPQPPAEPLPADAREPLLPAAEPRRLAPIEEPERWRRMIKNLLRQYWPRHTLIELMDDEVADRWTAKWIAEGCDFNRDVVPVVRDFCAMKPFCGPPAGFQELDQHVARNRARREGAAEANATPVIASDARTTSWGHDVLRRDDDPVSG